MLRPPSNQKTYDEFWSGDPAFVQPPPPPVRDDNTTDDEFDAQLAKHRQLLAEHERKVRVARETGDWSELLVGDSQPTRFQLRPLPGHLWRMIVDLVQSGRLGMMEGNSLMLRVALRGVVNFGNVDVKLEVDDAFPSLGKIATVEVPNLLDAINPRIVAELASTIQSRAMGVSPK